MTKYSGGRPGFREWIDKQADPGWSLMPLTHITKGIRAEDIIRTGNVRVYKDEQITEPTAYFFYGRPAYRVSGDGAVKVEAACPYCFVFDAGLILKAKSIHAFDTGAFANRLYKHILMDEMDVQDFSLEREEKRPNRLIARVFPSMKTYFDGGVTKAATPEKGADAWEFHARAYLQLLASPGRNEPDDRICSIEIVFGDAVPLEGNLKAIVVPHTLWSEDAKAPWLEELNKKGVEIAPYIFVPLRHPEHYHALLETTVRDLYIRWEIF